MDPVTVTRHESELGEWKHAQWMPSPGSPLAGLAARDYLRSIRYPGTTSLAERAEQFFQDTAS